MEKDLKEKLVRECSRITPESTFGQGSKSPITNLVDEFGDLLQSLEKEGEQKAIKALADPSSTPKTFLNIIKEGAKEFEQKTGRTMTYSEMRELYG